MKLRINFRRLSPKELVKLQFDAVAHHFDQEKYVPLRTPCTRISAYDPKALKEFDKRLIDSSMPCGDPISLANLRAGERVLDLGCGSGLDCLLAISKVGKSGHVFGVDVSTKMITLAKRNKTKARTKNVFFKVGDFANLAFSDESFDVIVSNSALNLADNKDPVFREAFRVLKDGGRFVFFDVVTIGKINDFQRENLFSWAGCLTGALDLNEYKKKLKAAGFKQIVVKTKFRYSSPASKNLFSVGILGKK